jgi:hypothetical protein
MLAENDARTKAKINPEYAAACRNSNAPHGLSLL